LEERRCAGVVAEGYKVLESVAVVMDPTVDGVAGA
jgi:hypothetical protein